MLAPAVLPFHPSTLPTRINRPWPSLSTSSPRLRRLLETTWQFQDELNTYLATEAGLRSVGGSLAIKVPKFFLQFQMARIQQAQGAVSDVPGQTVDHQLEKVLKNAAGEDQALLDEVNNLAVTLQ